ncbi:nuclear transport factor 2 family protein [Streptomyces flavofungini]|uniref:nuclear transport factor 2 family protein n=1 Tax=Streptomyces flavofungini TaxID=68200 RepID=UPI0025B082DD|nr:nuclear transport factor 2 family protein [Streptomyces flavofungini]WJV44680.1 nuclear transport factor 2 family protein [Streptomyces flavofungini]
MTTEKTGKTRKTEKTQNADTGESASNTLIVRRALAEVVGTGDVGALAKVLRDDFVHHRPDATSRTKAEWLAAVRASPLGDMRVDILHLLADGDHVVMHSRRRHPGTGAEITGVDIWRFDAGLIAEAWEILEPAQDAAAHLVWWEPTAPAEPDSLAHVASLLAGTPAQPTARRPPVS